MITIKKRYRDLTEKYKTFRIKKDSLFLSRLFQTFFNRFIKKGKKTIAKKLTIGALCEIRLTYRRPDTFNTLTNLINDAGTLFAIVPRRKSKIMLNVPVPIRRNKKEQVAVGVICSAAQNRTERSAKEKLVQELLLATVAKDQSATLKKVKDFELLVYEERVNLDLR